MLRGHAGQHHRANDVRQEELRDLVFVDVLQHGPIDIAGVVDQAVQTAAANTVGQWKTWYWICFGGIIVFLLSIPLLRGRWRTKDAKRDEEEHETLVQAELAKLNG